MSAVVLMLHGFGFFATPLASAQNDKSQENIIFNFIAFELFDTLVLKQFLLANLHETEMLVKSLSANALKYIYS